MTLLDLPRTSGGHFADVHGLLNAGLGTLDITPEEHRLVEERYDQIGQVLGEHWEGTRGDNRTFTQGSFRIGTVTRRIDNRTDIDIDLVALRDVDKASISQTALKEQVGAAADDFVGRDLSGLAGLTEDDRCWTVAWPGMHMDVLPALPATGAERGLLITDRSLRRWQSSDPEGFADWFLSKMRDEFRSNKAVLARELEVDDVPNWQVKTTLQRSVQALKRHRDLYFADHPDDRPSSIVLTTIAARAYRGTGPLLDVLQAITEQLTRHISFESGRWVLPNPVEPDENFTDYWNTDPSLPCYFREWAVAAANDFRELGNAHGLQRVTGQLERAFGSSAAQAAAGHVSSRLSAGRAAGTVGLVTGAGGITVAGPGSAAAARPAKSNTFYGGPPA